MGEGGKETLDSHVASAGSHTHEFEIAGHNTGDNSQNHQHQFTPTGTISNKGSSGTNANLPPYLAVYMWKRVS